MKVQELIKNISNDTFNLEKSLEIKKYIPIMDKKRFVMDIISECTNDVDDFVVVDRFKMNIYFDMKVLEAYTNLEIADDFDDMISQYDMLCENGVINQIVSLFKNDYDLLHTVLENVLDELLVQNSIEAQVVKIANKVNRVITDFGDKLNSIDFNAMIPEGVDINQLIDVMNKLK